MSLINYLDKDVCDGACGTTDNVHGQRARRRGARALAQAAAHGTRSAGYMDNGMHVMRLELRDALFDRMPSEKIADLLFKDAARARREVCAVIDLLVNEDARFSNLACDQRAELRSEVVDMVLGFGPIEGLLNDASVSEIMVNGPDSVFYERDGKLYACDVAFWDEQQLRMIIDRIVGPLGRRVDEQSPLVSARLPKGHRVNVAIPPLAIDGPALTIRKFREEVYSLDELVQMQTIDSMIAQLLKWAVLCRRNIAVSGGTGGGKTTLLNAMSVEIPHAERIITIEDAAELRFFEHPHVVRLEARPRNAEGTGEVTIRDLVINALRMRPDRIVVGECRGAEALDMLQAMNTGHDGSLTTLHANSPHEVVSRLVMMSRYAMELPVSLIKEQIASALDVIVQLDRFSDGTRRVTAICDVMNELDDDGNVVLMPLAKWDAPENRYVWTHGPSWLGNTSYANVISDEEVSKWRSSLGL